MAAPLFQRDEHEFVRLAALAQPDWEALRRLAHDDFDWQDVMEIALRHRMEGVVAWRCAAPELEGAVPETVRQECRDSLDHLEEANRAWLDDAVLAMNLLRDEGVRYSARGGPIDYYPLHIPVWPRAWDDLDFLISPEDHERALHVAQRLRRAGAVWADKDLFSLRLPSGNNVGLDYTRETKYESAWNVTDPHLIAVEQRLEWRGVAFPLPGNEAMVHRFGRGVWRIYSIHCGRVPVWGLARIANWAALPGFDWGRLIAWLKEDLEETAAGVRRYRIPFTRFGMVDITSKFSWAAGFAWAFDLADRVYGITARARRPGIYEQLAPARIPTPPMMACDGDYCGGGETRQHDGVAFTLGEWPGDEEFLFGAHQAATTLRERLALGIWQPAEHPRGSSA